jgi:predicted nucleotidyltransferase component of viral defense system
LITRHRITQRANDDGVDAAVVERDYVLAHIVAQLHRAALTGGGRLVFKGGTALRLVHVGEYRYSADLDFSVLDGTSDEALAALAGVVVAAKDHAGFPLLELNTESKPMVQYIGPLQASKPRELKVDLATDEHVETIEQLGVRPVWDDLPESVPFDVYPLGEIAAEKLRCVIQRLQCRDLFDLFQLVENLGVDLADIRPLFERKVEAKNLDPDLFPQRFEDRLPQYERRWNEEMGEHLPYDPPNFDGVIRIVRRHLRAAHLLGE